MLPNIGIYFPKQKYRFLQKLYFFVIVYHMVREFFLDIREYMDRTMKNLCENGENYTVKKFIT